MWRRASEGNMDGHRKRKVVAEQDDQGYTTKERMLPETYPEGSQLNPAWASTGFLLPPDRRGQDAYMRADSGA